jgi:hypothetical protein
MMALQKNPMANAHEYLIMTGKHLMIQQGLVMIQ